MKPPSCSRRPRGAMASMMARRSSASPSPVSAETRSAPAASARVGKSHLFPATNAFPLLLRFFDQLLIRCVEWR